MSSFTSFIPGFEANMDRLNQNRKRHAPPPQRVNEFEVARQSQRNEMFFTDEDDADFLFGSDDVPLVENNEPRYREIQPQTQTNCQAQNRTIRGGIGQSRPNTQCNTQSATRRDLNGTVNRPANNSVRPTPISTSKVPPAQPKTASTTVRIKDEHEMDLAADSDALRTIPPSQRVKIFVGRKNRSILVNRADLAKSPTLLSYIVDDPIQGSFIMRPQLMTTHYDDFAAVSQFLRNGEYVPLLANNAADQAGPKILNGLKTDEDYAKELVKSGKLYGLAKGFGVQGMADLVFKKISEVDSGRYSIDSLVRVTEVVFKDKANGNDGNNINEGAGTSRKDPMEEWIIGRLAFNFQEIMRTQPEKFFEVVRVTGKKMLYARVLEEVSVRYRESGGRLPEPVIELD